MKKIVSTIRAILEVIVLPLALLAAFFIPAICCTYELIRYGKITLVYEEDDEHPYREEYLVIGKDNEQILRRLSAQWILVALIVIFFSFLF